MKLLPDRFTHDGFGFRQVVRERNIVLLEKSKVGHNHPGYEVVIIQRHPAQSIHSREYPERESMPPSESWGTLGWSYSDLQAAKSKFDHLVTSHADTLSRPTPLPASALHSNAPNHRN
jgi:hypothetical protein